MKKPSNNTNREPLRCGLLYKGTLIPYPCIKQTFHTLVDVGRNIAVFELNYDYYIPNDDVPELWFPISEFGDVRDLQVSIKCADWGDEPVTIPGRLVTNVPPTVFQATAALKDPGAELPNPLYFHATDGPLGVLQVSGQLDFVPEAAVHDSKAADRMVAGRRVAWNGGGNRRFTAAASPIPPAEQFVRLIVYITAALPKPSPARSSLPSNSGAVDAEDEDQLAAGGPPRKVTVVIPLTVIYPTAGICSDTFTVDVQSSRAIRRVTAAHPSHIVHSQAVMDDEWRCGSSMQSSRRACVAVGNAHQWPLCGSIERIHADRCPPPRADDPEAPHRVCILIVEHGETIVPRMMDPMGWMVLLFAAILALFYLYREAERRGSLPTFVKSAMDSIEHMCYMSGACTDPLAATVPAATATVGVENPIDEFADVEF